ncbi:hypothetical protein BH09MYX1_BH09MYX1_53170 [soil metagenome]
MPRERTYWERHRTFARYPRAFGAFILAVGAAIVGSDLSTLHSGGFWTERGAILGPLCFLPGLWFVVFGYPIDEEGRVPKWYAVGLIGCLAAGGLVGAVLLLALLGRSV